MREVQTGPLVGLVVQLGLLAALAGTCGLDAAGWAVGLATAAVTAVALGHGLRADAAGSLTPADRVTLARATLVVGIAALVATSWLGPTPVRLLVSLTTVALLLDALDGAVARRTGSVSEHGARFDMEVDAYLILVLCVAVAPAVGAWVLLIGAARYVYVAAGWLLPWLRLPLPARRWRKVVAALQGIVLVVVLSGVLAPAAAQAALLVALVLLAESFGRDVRWQWVRRPAPRAVVGLPTGVVRPTSRAAL